MEKTPMKKKFRIFVSSVGKMMDEERITLRDLIWKSGNLPIAMEGFSGNNNQTSIDVIKGYLEQADVVIFVLGFTYGSIVGDALDCKVCPVKGTCNVKKKKTGACTASYTHFEFMYAKQEGILTYCIIQEKIEVVDLFERRINAYNSGHAEQTIGTSLLEDLRKEYYGKIDDYKRFLTEPKKNYSYFYDANSSSGIAQSITTIFSLLQSKLVVDGENLNGLIDAAQAKQELMEKNRRIAELEKDIRDQRETLVGVIRNATRVNLPKTAVTGTCIPIKYDPKEDVIYTYLVCNEAYNAGSRLMFPGGHAFVSEEEDTSPETTAISKAKKESGLLVKPIDFYTDYVISGDYQDQFSACRPPHFTYLFKQNTNAKCYREQNHHYHYDAVYICEISETYNEVECTQKRIPVKLPNRRLQMTEIKKCLNDAIKRFNIHEETPEQYGDYIVKMLFDAHNLYINRSIKKKQEVQHQ